MELGIVRGRKVHLVETAKAFLNFLRYRLCKVLRQTSGIVLRAAFTGRRAPGRQLRGDRRETAFLPLEQQCGAGRDFLNRRNSPRHWAR